MFWWVLENTLIAAVLALLVALVCRARRLPPVIRHALWLVVLIRLITPPVFALSLFSDRWRNDFVASGAVEVVQNARRGAERAPVNDRDAPPEPGLVLDNLAEAETTGGSPAATG